MKLLIVNYQDLGLEQLNPTYKTLNCIVRCTYYAVLSNKALRDQILRPHY